jgi:hypothetical protein
MRDDRRGRLLIVSGRLDMVQRLLLYALGQATARTALCLQYYYDGSGGGEAGYGDDGDTRVLVLPQIAVKIEGSDEALSLHAKHMIHILVLDSTEAGSSYFVVLSSMVLPCPA